MKSKIEKLEMLRGFTAAYIMVGHFCVPAFNLRGAVTLPFIFGQEAVMTFFLLSGFVIYYSTHLHRDQSFVGYFKRRFIRIYPIFVLALAVAGLVKWLVGQFVLNGWELAGNLCLLQDFAVGKPGTWFDTGYGNLPLWSLSYEWWFYMLFFPLYKWVAPRWQLFVAAAVSVTGLVTYAWHPNQISLFLLYFILWWCGLELGRTYSQGIAPTFANQRRTVCTLASVCMLVVAVLLGWMPRPAHYSYGLHPLLEIRHFVATFVLLCAGLTWSSFRWRGFTQIFGVFSRVAPISYAIYVFHYPVGLYIIGLEWIPTPILRVVVAFALTLTLAYLAEIPLQRQINAWVRRSGPRPALRPAAQTPA